MRTEDELDATSNHDSKRDKQANTSGKTPVVFIHGLWLLPNCWDRWAKVFKDAGYSN